MSGTSCGVESCFLPNNGFYIYTRGNEPRVFRGPFFLRVGLKSRRGCKIIIRTERLDFSLDFARETDTVATLVMSEIQCGWRGNFYLVLHSQILSPLLIYAAFELLILQIWCLYPSLFVAV
ncbi:hypothetical protein NC651_030763 [Populus alba x Populus x berolinensis]|nr:hypothetical protein NC651_030763 [Populus alba x Populus x berolinensis]